MVPASTLAERQRTGGAITAAQTKPVRCAPIGRGGGVHWAFWLAAAGLTLALLVRAQLSGSSATLVATLVFIGGGLPHGAYDIALLARVGTVDRSQLALAILGYIAIAATMAALWLAMPLAALIVFLTAAAVHFGEDWSMIDEPLLKMAAGTAIIAAPAIGHPTEVARLFVAMVDGGGGLIVARTMLAAAPVTVLVTVVGIVAAWRDGAREWAAAMAVAIAMLIVAPPVAGFALFFVFLHSPRHLAAARSSLRGMSPIRWLATGAVMSTAAIVGWLAVSTSLPRLLTPDITAQAFQLLAAVAVPHLVLSRWIDRQLARRDRQPRTEPIRGSRTS